MTKSNKTTAVIVVTFNRKNQLVTTIEKLLQQSNRDFDLFIIDNCSTDGTYEYLESNILLDKVFYFNTGENIGGAGGFNFGIKTVLDHSNEYKYVWLMDDDTYAEQDAHRELINAADRLNNNFGFLSSVVLWKNGKYCEMNRQRLVRKWYKKMEYLDEGLILTDRATFVSFFTSIKSIYEVGLPISDFFIWGDDIEYSNRISKKNYSFVVGKSKVVHYTETNVGSDISKDDKSKLWKYKYAYRNEVYIAKNNGIRGRLYQFAKIGYHILRVLGTRCDNKIKRISIILGCSIKGLFFNPRVEVPKEGD
ncbi:multidrug MFS transporter [Erysipelothrix larvae]|uniref:Multidrug MFS transporter n=1 Tax=Erysipelothrix larvae TaxID=1514105 RepID=A0A0X8H233_9FIRM|nr:glycosyltransferase family 2 protein [Erysipelothrix larvae]AMC94657.1 multidrug MFS transporter [Erysipelothrix larvae]